MVERKKNPIRDLQSEIHLAEVHARGRMQGALRRAAKILLNLGLFPTEQVADKEGLKETHLFHLGQLDEDKLRGIYIDCDGEISLLKRNSNYEIDVADIRQASDVHYFKYSKLALSRMNRIYRDSQLSQEVSS